MANLFLYVLLSFLLLLLISDARSIISEPQAAGSFNVSLIQNVGSCPYTVIISTSCSSPKYTRDHISIAFGDEYGNQGYRVPFDPKQICINGLVRISNSDGIYAPGLEDPSTKTFEQCSSDTFQINGPCAYQICYMYLYRTGPDGWVPENVKVYGRGSKAIKFNYNTYVPESIWYGFNYCNSASGSNRQAIGFGWFVFVLVGFAVTAKLV